MKVTQRGQTSYITHTCIGTYRLNLARDQVSENFPIFCCCYSQVCQREQILVVNISLRIRLHIQPAFSVSVSMSGSFFSLYFCFFVVSIFVLIYVSISHSTSLFPLHFYFHLKLPSSSYGSLSWFSVVSPFPHLYFIFFILNLEVGKTVRKIYEKQKASCVKGDWIELVREDIKFMDIDMDDNQIRNYPKEVYRQKLKKNW